MEPLKHQRQEFIEAYDQYADGLFRHCYFKVSNRELALDLVQETFTKAWNAISKGQTVDNLKPFLYRIANNLIVDEYRKKKSVSLDELRNEGFDVAGADGQSISTMAEVRIVLASIDKLEGKYREVIELRYVSDLSPREIADVLGETENAVSVRINRALKQMRTMLNTND
jgi:RNA polymerase sigma-70 factor, ECF subfamily